MEGGGPCHHRPPGVIYKREGQGKSGCWLSGGTRLCTPQNDEARRAEGLAGKAALATALAATWQHRFLAKPTQVASPFPALPTLPT